MKNYDEYLLKCIDLFFEEYSGRDKFAMLDDVKRYSGIITSNGFVSKRHGISYNLLAERDSVIVICNCYDPRKIKTMDYRFWKKFIQLDYIGKLTFRPYSVNNKISFKPHLRSHNSAIYDIIKEILLMDEYDNFSVDFGYLEVVIKFGLDDIENLSYKVVLALNLLHSINNDMYRGTSKNS